MRKNLILFCFVLPAAGISYAQSTNTYLNNYVQPAPNVAALGKYIDFPVSYFSGVPEINIPIYNLKDGAANVPISLSYHASGVRVSEVASWVGLGWALNAGGMITRTVQGAPDEGTRMANSYGPRGYYVDYGITHFPLLPHPVNGQIVTDASAFDMTRYTAPGISNGDIDGEPDLFFFNFNGYSGKFVFDENRTPRLLTDDNLQIAVNFDSYYGQFSSWTITTPDGAKYLFGENNMHEVTAPHTTTSGDSPDSQLPSSWYLTRIIYPNSKDTVYFNYTTETYTYFDLGPETELYNFQGSANILPVSSVCNFGDIKQGVIRTTVNGLRLISIQSKNYTVSFVANTLRLDLANYSAKPPRLDSIRISTNQGTSLSQFAFGYDYFTSSLNTTLTNLGFVNDSSDTKRLKLISLTPYSGDKSISQPPYQFQYQDTFQLPRRLSYDQDHWGYSNNASGNSNPFFTPAMSYAYACSGGGANREPSWPQMEAGALLSIQSPLGTLTKFEFEPDSADNYATRMVGGLRIHRIKITDNVTGVTTIKKFQYAGGVIFRVPKYIINLKNEFYVPNTIGQTSGYQGYSYNSSMGMIGVLKQSQSIVPLQDIQGFRIGYASVKELFGENAEGGYKEYHYGINYRPTGNSRLSVNNYAATQSVNTIFYGTVTSFMGNGHFNDILPQDLQYYSGYDVDEYFPTAPYQVEFTNGKLLSEFTYDASGTLIENIQNNYKEIFHEDYSIRGLKIYRTYKYVTPSSTGSNSSGPYAPASSFIYGINGVIHIDFPASGGYSISWQTPAYNDALTYYKLHTGISHLTSSVVTDYKDGKSFVTTHNYGYESAYHTLQTSDTTTNSIGDVLIKKTYYSFDYANTATSDNVFAKMKARNMLVPVATREWKNSKLRGGTITQFQDFATSSSDSLINPSAVYNLETASPLTVSQSGETIKLNGLIGTLIPNTYFIEKADFSYDGTTGKINQQNLFNDKKQSLIWDDQTSLPLAVVDNAVSTKVAYAGFETTETGNWAYTGSSVVTDVTAPTGAHVYTLGSSNAISKSGLTSSKDYVISYWIKSGASITITGGTQSNALTGRTLNGWTYHEVTITGTTSVSITGSGYVDELRLYPVGAQMTTYTYDALLRLIATCGPNSTISYYEYDGFNRLLDIKDQFGNIIKAFEYNYGGLSR